MALGFFPPRLLFSVLISPGFPAPLPGLWAGEGRQEIVGTRAPRGREDARRPVVAGVWRMPLHLHVPRDKLLHFSAP